MSQLIRRALGFSARTGWYLQLLADNGTIQNVYLLSVDSGFTSQINYDYERRRGGKNANNFIILRLFNVRRNIDTRRPRLNVPGGGRLV